MIAAERETVVTVSDVDAQVHVWTAQRSVIFKLSEDLRWETVEIGEVDGSPFGVFTIESDRWSLLTGTKPAKRPPSAAQLASRAKFIEGVRCSQTATARGRSEAMVGVLTASSSEALRGELTEMSA